VISRHPAVRHSVVVGVSDPKWQERVVALVELRSKSETITLAELQDHCRRHLAGYKVPRDLVICEIARTPAGKVDYPWARAFAERALARNG
jgi:acyl-CoA synthetase (AMP-forming)/AMP-acid ligase II